MVFGIPPAVVGALITLVGGGTITLFGWLWRRYQAEKKKRTQLEAELDELDDRIETVWKWAFGFEDDATDEGIAEDIAQGFADVDGRLNRLESRVSELEDLMVDSEKTDIERDDVE